jgi:hypothetical protein
MYIERCISESRRDDNSFRNAVISFFTIHNPTVKLISNPENRSSKFSETSVSAHKTT